MYPMAPRIRQCFLPPLMSKRLKYFSQFELPRIIMREMKTFLRHNNHKKSPRPMETKSERPGAVCSDKN